MGFTLYRTQSEENRRLKPGKIGLFLISIAITLHKLHFLKKPIG